MSNNNDVYGSFCVTSGCLCFGALHNIWSGSLAPIQAFERVEPERSGTIQVHALTHNIVALNGTWNICQLIDLPSRKVAGWFAYHSDVDPDQEIDKILRISGSPYEEDSGSRMNDNNTFEHGVLVINRYDWRHYAKQYMDEIAGVSTDDSVGLVDHAHAQTHVQNWKERRSSQRGLLENGILMDIPDAEYCFGRFGFNEARTAARSFLFFSTNTNFTSTAIAGRENTLRIAETNAERFARRLREGFDFSGLSTLRMMTAERSEWPTMSDRLGPFDKAEHILTGPDCELLLPTSTIYNHWVLPDFIDPWKEPVYDLLNELALSYLLRYALPRLSEPTTFTAEAIAKTLFPAHENKQLERELYAHFTRPYEMPMDGIDTGKIGSRIQAFFMSHASTESPMAFENEDIIAGISRVILHLISKLLDTAGYCARDNGRNTILPSDIRLTLLLYSEMYPMMAYSASYWGNIE